MRRHLLLDAPGPGPVWLRPLGGAQERAVAGAGTAEAVALLDRLLVDCPGAAARPGEAARITTGDRDRLLAAIWEEEFGTRIEVTLSCAACAAPYDLDFHLPDLRAALRADPPAGFTRDADGIFQGDGCAFRLPTGADELAVESASPEDAAALLVARCVLAGDAVTAEAAMARLSPLLDIDLDAACPDCGAAQAVPFAIERALLGRLAAGQSALWRDAHLLAATYRWSLPEILSLTRGERRALVRLVEAERDAMS